MKFEEQIQACFDLYPDLYQHRWEVLDQMFCAFGTGYRWENGELVNVGEEFKKHKVTLSTDGIAKPDTSHPEKELQETFLELKKRNGHYYEMYKKDGLDKIAEKYSDEGLLAQARELNKRRPYLSFSALWREASPLLNLPKDIKPDWLEGAKETVRLLHKANEVSFPEDDSDSKYYLKDRANNNKLINGLTL